MFHMVPKLCARHICQFLDRQIQPGQFVAFHQTKAFPAFVESTGIPTGLGL
jgi:hypothetical protein